MRDEIAGCRCVSLGNGPGTNIASDRDLVRWGLAKPPGE